MPKVCSEEEEEEEPAFLSTSETPIGFLCQMQNRGTSHTELWVLLSLRQGTTCGIPTGGILQSRKCSKQKQKRCRHIMSGKLIGSKARSHARTKETLKRGVV
jgi:hypothetical protein